MKKKKAFFLFFITVTALFLLFCISASAAVQEGNFGKLSWRLVESTGILTISGRSSMSDFEAYSTDAWLEYADRIQVVIIKEGVTSIGARAFSRCTNLTTVHVPNSLNRIGEYAFFGCTAVSDLYISSISAWCNVYIDNSSDAHPFGSSEGGKLYLNDSPLENLSIGGSVTEIGRMVFYNCINLNSVVLGSTVQRVEQYAFYNCKNLTSVTIENNAAKIAAKAFGNCTAIREITMPTSGNSLGYIFGASSYQENPDYVPITLKSVILLNNTTLPSRYFRLCSSLKSITLSSSITSIGYETFYGCLSLNCINLGEKVNSIGENAFWGCTHLKNIRIPAAVEKIGKNAFEDCEELETVYIDSPEVARLLTDSASCGGLISNASVVYMSENATNSLPETFTALFPCVVREDRNDGAPMYFAYCKAHTCNATPNVLRPATHTETGLLSYNCVVCGAETIAEEACLPDHSFGDWQVVREPTETEDGTQESICPCGQIQYQRIPMLSEAKRKNSRGLLFTVGGMTVVSVLVSSFFSFYASRKRKGH